jgi:hypothetical protein
MFGPLASRKVVGVEMASAFSIGNPRSNPAPTVQKSAKSLKLKKFYALLRVGVCWRDEAVPKSLCRHIGRCRDIGVRRGGRCRAFSCWTGASSVSCRGGPRRRRAPVTPWASTVMAKILTHLGLSIRAPPRATFAVIGPTPNGLNTKYRSGMDAAGRAGCPLYSNRSPIPSGSAPEPTLPLGPHSHSTPKRPKLGASGQ